MNEKHQQYFNLKNDKALIERKEPTASDLEKFEILKTDKRKQLKNSLLILPFSILFIIVRNSFR